VLCQQCVLRSCTVDVFLELPRHKAALDECEGPVDTFVGRSCPLPLVPAVPVGNPGVLSTLSTQRSLWCVCARCASAAVGIPEEARRSHSQAQIDVAWGAVLARARACICLRAFAFVRIGGSGRAGGREGIGGMGGGGGWGGGGGIDPPWGCLIEDAIAGLAKKEELKPSTSLNILLEGLEASKAVQVRVGH
jgi:hypothetical protein